MNLSEFKTDYQFRKWFFDNRNYRKYYFTYMNLYGETEYPNTRVFRLTDKNKTLGLCLISEYDNREIFINLFEIKEEFCGKGYGKTMFNLLVQKLKPKYIQLDYAGNDAYKFWKHLGFHKRRGYNKKLFGENNVYKIVKKKEYEL